MVLKIHIDSQWVLEKCSKYLSGVIYNMEESMKEDEADINLSSS